MIFKSDIDVELIDHMGSDRAIVRAARVSTRGEASKDHLLEDSEVRGLLNYLIKHRHGTPFEHGAMTFFVNAPIFVWREWHRHRVGFSYNEESARYKKLEPVFYVPSADRPCIKVDDWKPGRPKFYSPRNDLEAANLGFVGDNLRSAYDLAYHMYEDNLSLGIDPGLARDCLPVGIYSACWVTCNPRSLMHFLSLRVGSDESTYRSYPLWEIDHAARKLEEIFATLWPITHGCFVANGRLSP